MAKSKEFKTGIVIGGKLSTSVQSAFAKLTGYYKKTSKKLKETNQDSKELAKTLKAIGKESAASIKSASKTAALAGGTALVGGALAGGGAMLSEAANLEQYRNTLDVVMKDQEKASKTFKWAVNYANKTPFETGEIVDATVKLQSYGLTATKILPQVGDMAAAMGKGMDQAVEAIADAQTGELERLKEFGITKQQIIDHGNKIMRGKEIVNAKGQITDQKAFNKVLLSLMDERFSGSMEKQATSMKGLWSTITGVRKNGLAKIAGISSEGLVVDGSFFDVAKQQIEKVAIKMQELQENGTFDMLQQNLGKFATDVGNAINQALPHVMNFVNFVLTHFPQIMTTIKFVSVAFAGFKVVSGISGAIKFTKDLGDAIKLLNAEKISSTAKKIQNLTDSILGNEKFKGMASKGLDIFKSSSNSIKNSIDGLKTYISSYKKIIAVKVADKTETAILAGMYAKDAAARGLVAIKNGILTASTYAMSAAQAVATGATTALGAAFTFLTGPIGIAMLAIAGIVAVGYLIYKNWSLISSSVSGWWYGSIIPAFQAGQAAVVAVWNGIKSGFTSMKNTVVSGLNAIIDKINSIKLPDWVPFVGGKGLSIPKFAKGGLATQPSICGEAGPEMVIPLNNKSRSQKLLERTNKFFGYTPTEGERRTISPLKPKTAKEIRVKKPKPTGNGGGIGGSTLTVVYAPNITCSSKEDLKEQLDEGFEKFKEYMKKFKEDEKRDELDEPVFDI